MSPQKLDPANLLRRLAAVKRQIKQNTLPARQKRLEAERQSLTKEFVEANIHLVHHWVNVYGRRLGFRRIDRDDMVQEGSLGLMRAVELYDPRKGRQFSSYAAIWIRKFILRLGKRAQDTADTPCDPEQIDTLAVSDSEGLRTADANTTFDLVASTEKRSAIFASLGHLDARSRDVITARFGVGRKMETLDVIASRHEISGQRVWQIQQDAIKKLKKSPLLTSIMTTS